ncbi:MAG: cyclophilin family peptidyl-prolyl cis-trans isomerase [Pseudomonadales bacterium]|jgi:cyclophilin family peptidyl-prolyl cis-trans isomerase
MKKILNTKWLASLAMSLLLLPVIALAADKPVVVLETNFGNIEISLNQERAPITVANFLSYVDEGFYDDTIFHRVIPDFMVQGGGFTKSMKQKPGKAPIINESSNRLHNDRYTVAMARTNDPNSATSQFFINVRTNGSLDFVRNKPGYAVFGEITAGKEVVYTISLQSTGRKSGFGDVPEKNIFILKAYRKVSE